MHARGLFDDHLNTDVHHLSALFRRHEQISHGCREAHRRHGDDCRNWPAWRATGGGCDDRICNPGAYGILAETESHAGISVLELIRNPLKNMQKIKNSQARFRVGVDMVGTSISSKVQPSSPRRAGRRPAGRCSRQTARDSSRRARRQRAAANVGTSRAAARPRRLCRAASAAILSSASRSAVRLSAAGRPTGRSVYGIWNWARRRIGTCGATRRHFLWCVTRRGINRCSGRREPDGQRSARSGGEWAERSGGERPGQARGDADVHRNVRYP